MSEQSFKLVTANFQTKARLRYANYQLLNVVIQDLTSDLSYL